MKSLFLKCNTLKRKKGGGDSITLWSIVMGPQYKKMMACYLGVVNEHWRPGQKKMVMRSFHHVLYFLVPWHCFYSVEFCTQRNFKSVLCLSKNKNTHMQRIIWNIPELVRRQYFFISFIGRRGWAGSCMAFPLWMGNATKSTQFNRIRYLSETESPFEVNYYFTI